MRKEVIIFIMIIYPAIVFCGGIAFPGIDEIFKKNNISVEYNQDSYKSFKDYVQLLMTESSVKKKQSASPAGSRRS